MGFLQHDTSAVILDAVLTDLGRSFLSRNDGSFSIVKFALGDDECNYNIIRQFGRTVGKEKIEKNTPVFEAQTLASLALKHRCVSVSNPNLIRLPTLSLTGEGQDSTGTVISMGNVTLKTRALLVSQVIQNEASIDVELRDQVFIVELDHRFLHVIGQTPDGLDSSQRASYLVQRDAIETSLGGSKLSFSLAVKTITDAMFSVFGTTSNKSLIRTYVKVSGLQSGAVLEFEVQVTKAT